MPKLKHEKEQDFYVHTPWKSLDEYYALVKKHGCGGVTLANLIKKEQKKKAIPYPKMKIPKGF